MAVARAMLDERHDSLPQDRRDYNSYALGRIGPHNVVIACLPEGVMGVTSVARVAEQMSWTFRALRFGLMVGIGGGVPSAEHDIRLGDVVVSKPTGSTGGVIQYDYGKTVETGRFERMGLLNRPPDELLQAVSSLKAGHLMDEPVFPRYLLEMGSKFPRLRHASTAPRSQDDQLFETDYNHVVGEATCAKCDANRLVSRPKRADNIPIVHYGLIASGNQVLKDGQTRERLRRELNVLCFEMEAAGLMDSFPCLVIRGICDYADTHKNKLWQGYAAASAAAYAKELLNTISGTQVMVIRTVNELTEMAEPARIINSVPFPRDRAFVRRELILSQMEERIGREYCLSLCGMGGVGKSQIAIEYAYQYREHHPQSHIFWVDTANATRFVQSYQDIARRLNLPGSEDPQVDMCQLVSNWLDNEEVSGWLIIVDNADDAGLFLHGTVIGGKSGSGRTIVDYLPKQLNTKRCMIVTTRNRDIGEALAHGEPCIEVGPFSIEESINLLRSKGRGVINHVDGPAMEKLVEKLGRIPLAIAQAAAYMNRNRISVQKYLAALEKDEQNLIDYLSVELQDHRRPRGHPNSIFRTWRLSFEQIRLHDVRAAELLSLMAMLDGQQIPQDLAQRNDERDVDFLAALGTLAGYSLVMPSGEEVWTMHALVQLSVQDWLAAAEQRTNMVEEAVRLVAGRFPNGEHKNRVKCEVLLPHARAVLRHASGLDSSIKDCATLLHNVGCFEMQQGRYARARESVQKAYELRREVLGNNDVSTIGSLDLFGQVLGYHGMYEQAGDILRQSLDLYKTVVGKEHPDTFRSMNNLAEVLWYQGKYEQAGEMHGQALKLRETVLGKEHPDTLTSMDNLALALNDQGKYERAEEMHRQALGLRETVLGREHPDTLTSMNNLSSALDNQGKYEQAEEMHRQALRLKETVLGNEHPSTLASMNNLASALSNQGKYEQAEEIYRQVLRLDEAVLGEEHPYTLMTMNNLASVLSDQGKYVQAEEMHRQALRLRETVLGKEHPDTLTSMGSLALVLGDQGKYEQAEEMHRQALRLKETVLGNEHPSTLTSMNDLALVLRSQGKYEQAEEIHRQVLRLYETVLGEEHPYTLTSMSNLASVLGDQGKYAQAEEMHRQALRLRETVLGREHPDTLMSMNNLASVLGDQGKYTQAEEMHRQALRLRETVLGKEHPDTLTSMADLALIYWNQRQWDKAEILEGQVMETRSRLLGHRHPDTLTAMANLAYTWKSQGQDQNAIDLMRQVESLQREILGVDHPHTTASSETVDRWVAANVKESAGH